MHFFVINAYSFYKECCILVPERIVYEILYLFGTVEK